MARTAAWGRTPILLFLVVVSCSGSSSVEDGGVVREPDAGSEIDGRPDVITIYGNAGGPCTPGVPRCSGDFGYQVCEQEGIWGPPRSCAGYSEDGTSSGLKLGVTDDDLRDDEAHLVERGLSEVDVFGGVPADGQEGVA